MHVSVWSHRFNTFIAIELQVELEPPLWRLPRLSYPSIGPPHPDLVHRSSRMAQRRAQKMNLSLRGHSTHHPICKSCYGLGDVPASYTTLSCGFLESKQGRTRFKVRCMSNHVCAATETSSDDSCLEPHSNQSVLNNSSPCKPRHGSATSIYECWFCPWFIFPCSHALKILNQRLSFVRSAF